MPSFRANTSRQRFGTLQRGTTTTNKQQRKRKNQILYGIFLILVCFVLLPVLYLQRRLVASHKRSPVDQDLQDFHRFSTTIDKKRSKKRVNNHEEGQRRRPFEHESRKEGGGDKIPAGNFQPSRESLKFDADPLVLTAYLEPPETISASSPLVRNTTATRLQRIEFPRVSRCSTLMQDFPVNNYPTADPYLPWIHDYFVSSSSLSSSPEDNNKTSVHFVAQNRRRCGDDDALAEYLAKWDPQISLFQPIPIIVESSAKGAYRLGTSREEATHSATRFQCHFHRAATSSSSEGSSLLESAITFSEYPFDYEYVTWRKTRKSMVDPTGGKDMASFWLSQLLFSCPIPDSFRGLLTESADDATTRGGINEDKPAFHLDLIPIRTPTRNKVFLSEHQVGHDPLLSLDLFDAKSAFGTAHYLPKIQDAGRWANLPICPPRTDQLLSRPKTIPDTQSSAKPYRLVGCTWTSASYTRRGDAVRISDSAKRLEEWIRFHLLVGVDYLYVYDNSNDDNTELLDVTNKFPGRVTHHRWPCQICNNNRPAHSNPGERSSQYAAEASCRERYGPTAEWMTFVDTDEYLIPMKPNDNGEYKWDTVLDEMDTKNISILKFVSSRGKPRIDLME
jgi:hypothetical protein